MLTEKQTVVKEYEFLGTRVVGDGILRLKHVKGWLTCNWEGHVCNYSKNVPDISKFSPVDKGGLAVFGINKDGRVIVGMALYKGEYYCKPCSDTNCWQ